VRAPHAGAGTLRQSPTDFEDSFEPAPIGLLWVSPEGTVVRINQAALDLLGRRRDECVGLRVAEFHADPDVSDDIRPGPTAGYQLCLRKPTEPFELRVAVAGLLGRSPLPE
jgi:PAS domain-containing protein